MLRASQIASSLGAEECAKAGLTPPQHAFLIVLSKCSGLDQRDLGKALGIDRVTAGQVLRTLETRGLVRRVGSSNDGRRKLVSLTAEGRKHVAPAQAAMRRVSARLLSALEPAERRVFADLLLKMVIALNQESVTPVEPPGGAKGDAHARSA
ncbi:MAG: MarR family winged helix-turn-helix transcriptional regulator [Gammaproteobacteria bacterium]